MEMGKYLLADQILQYSLNAFSSFFLFAFLTEACLKIFKIRNPRLRASFRIFPLLRLVLAPLLLLFPKGTSLVNASLFNCLNPMQAFFLESLSEVGQAELRLHGLKTMSGKLLLMIPVPALYIGITLLFAISIYRLASLLMQCVQSAKQIKGICGRGKLSPRHIHNEKLRLRLKKQKTMIMFSDEISVPLAGWGNCILIPEALANRLSQQEFEAVISHELEHHRWSDTQLRVFYSALAAIYWWIPMTGWLNKIIQDQELASDAVVHDYQLSGLQLATALNKTIKGITAQRYQCAAFACEASSARGGALIERIQSVLDPDSRKQSKASATAGTLCMIGLLAILGFAVC